MLIASVGSGSSMGFSRLDDRARAWELFAIINPINHGRAAADIATYIPYSGKRSVMRMMPLPPRVTI